MGGPVEAGPERLRDHLRRPYRRLNHELAAMTSSTNYLDIPGERRNRMAEYREVTPVAGPEAFESIGRDAELSQAAIVLSAGAAVGGRADRIDRPEALGLPIGLRQISREHQFSVGEAAAGLDLDLRTHLDDRALRLPSSASAALTRRLIDRPTAPIAAALVEANLHSETLLVRTSAAVAALDTTGPRDDVLDRLVEGARSRDDLTREIGRIGVARVAPQHAVLRRLVVQAGPRLDAVGAAAGGEAVLTHGTFSANTQWWQPGGGMYDYLDALVPALNMHDPSFRWSGQYSDGARRLAAQQLVDWAAGSGLQTPDVFAHSLFGIMFDDDSVPREGAVGFADATLGNDTVIAASARNQPLNTVPAAFLRTLVHEAGHAFNLFHPKHDVHSPRHRDRNHEPDRRRYRLRDGGEPVPEQRGVRLLGARSAIARTLARPTGPSGMEELRVGTRQPLGRSARPRRRRGTHRRKWRRGPHAIRPDAPTGLRGGVHHGGGGAHQHK